MSLRKILGGSGRVKKPSAKRPSTTSSSSWTASLPRSKPAAKHTGKTTTTTTSKGDDYDDDYDLFDDKLDDHGLVRALATDLNLRDTSQAIHYIRAHMFSPVPEQAAGMGSVKISEVLNFRKNLPRIVSVSHIQALLTCSPSAVEREIAELVRSGFLLRIVVARRGDIGDTLLLATEFAQLVQDSPSLGDDTKASFLAHLRQNPGRQTIDAGSCLTSKDVDHLIKCGFLTSHHIGATSFASMSETMNLYSRPEDKGTLTSLEVVSRQATGSLGAVGGQAAVYMAGGSAGGSSQHHHHHHHGAAASATDLKLAVPGNGTFLKLVSSALEHLVALLTKANSKFRELPESVLRDRWDGGISKDEPRYAAKRSRREFAGILPGQTRKWRQFDGLAFDWVLQEAVGSGLVEVFETGSVGRGVRALSGR
ncbi:serine-threonine protein kinase 19-domain-containing protein [Microdochium trichocladiopsis]|uniref:Serine-threonine protein kinase 19-domain-containing protein n=1 Tax=Microdochium trichocladiopsis TaxID=1682393 RepID=A0A9P8YDM2_9PEZI|nr:serine-threonine protein kinase 19-domain-containing protein [Microdochium trichocladiopsis]KAH7035118.1 serine-threonine protein kinase 19-domain-containing protein [Microdochium trichocladiopsis]